MYNKTTPTKTKISVNTSYAGETIENKVRRILNNKEGITDGAPLIYTDRKDGVDPGHNIRTDRFEIAIEATDKIQKSKIAEREDRQLLNKMGKEEYDKMKTMGKEAYENMIKENSKNPS